MVWVVAPQDGISGQLMENQLPSFWSDSLSRILGDTPVGLELGGGKDDGIIRRGSKANDSAPTRKGQKTSTEEKRARAKKMRAGGHSYGEIAKTLGISRTYAFKLVNDSTEPSPAKAINELDLEGLIKNYLSNP